MGKKGYLDKMSPKLLQLEINWVLSYFIFPNSGSSVRTKEILGDEVSLLHRYNRTPRKQDKIKESSPMRSMYDIAIDKRNCCSE